MRVVSLLPSATEIVHALGIEPVGVSHECDHPPRVTELPSVNRSRVDPEASTAEINRQVVEAERGGGVYEVDVETLARLEPDLIVTQGVCEVCAVGDRLVEEAVADLGLDAEILTTHPHSLEDVLGDVRRIGERTGNEGCAREVIRSFRGRIDRVRERAPATGRRVVVADWMDPVMVAGHWIPGMIETAGGAYGMADPGERSRPRPFEDLLAYDPEVLIAAPCGFTLDRTTEHIEELTGREGYGDLTAAREGRVYAMDGQHYVNRPGPRLVDTLEHLAGLIAPEAFDAPPRDVAGRVETRETPAD